MIKKFYRKTPLIPFKIGGKANQLGKNSLSDFYDVYLKLENLQPSGSFKDRGISNMINLLYKKDPNMKLLVSSSGGNAGHSVASVGLYLGIPVEVFVPITTKQMMIEKIKSKGAKVTIIGNNWNEADMVAREKVNSVERSYYIPPFDDPMIWDGNSTIVDELKDSGIAPDKIILSVGGGGLLSGIQRGIIRNGWLDRTKIVAVETEGTSSFALAKSKGYPEKLQKIDSIATSLGALSVTFSSLNSPVKTDSLIVKDQDAIIACKKFCEDFNMLVEPACGASLSVAYTEKYKDLIDLTEDGSNPSNQKKNLVIVVCGGSIVNLELMNEWCNKFLQ